jgi:hypothetical protein
LNAQTYFVNQSACRAALKSFESNPSAICATVRAIVALEDDPILNAGTGSNLTKDCTVECDAGIMDGVDEAFGSVAAVSGPSSWTVHAYVRWLNIGLRSEESNQSCTCHSQWLDSGLSYLWPYSADVLTVERLCSAGF